MTDAEKQRWLELQAYIEPIKDMTLKEIAVQHLKKYHLPKFLSGLLVKFSYPLLLAKDYQLLEAEELLKRCHDDYIYLQPLRGEIEQFLANNF